MMINQKWSPEAYHHAGSFVPDLAGDLINDLNPKPNEKILDLGCGNGVLTKKILRSTKNVIGIDSSDAMVQAAKKIGIDSYLIDGEAIPFRNVFDAVFSNAALHWIQNQDAVLRGVHKCLKPKGRFVGEFGGHGNISCLIAIIETVMKAKPFSCSFNNPWYFPSTDEFSKKLSASDSGSSKRFCQIESQFGS
jgi:2-isopropylmalate synthase